MYAVHLCTIKHYVKTIYIIILHNSETNVYVITTKNRTVSVTLSPDFFGWALHISVAYLYGQVRV